MTLDLTIEDLAKQSGLSLRTLRYYIQEGLLPGPDTQGKYARYSQAHLDQLELILRLKRLRLPLNEIRHLLENMTLDEIRQVRQLQDIIYRNLPGPSAETQGKISISDSGSSALDYIHSLEIEQRSLRSITGSPSGYPQVQRGGLSTPAHISSKEQFSDGSTKPQSWTRLVLREGVELNISAKEAARMKNEMDQLIQFARKIFRDDSTKGEKK
jgi:DNA-binding transcriptional MerR regulator